jgi:F-type H+-transporting ATPase subunit b
MSFFTRKPGWFAVLALCAAGFIGRTVAAAAADESPQATASEAAHEAEETEAAGDPNPLAFRTDLAIWTFIVFVLLFAFLSYFAWPQIATALDERERRIADNIAAAEARLADAQKVLVEHEKKLAAAAGEVRELLEEARRDAEHTRRSIEAKGHQAAQDELARALREIDRAKDGAIQHLAEVSANVAIDLARKVVREQLSPQVQSQLVRDALARLTAGTPSEN